jgi:hypothetical protein
MAAVMIFVYSTVLGGPVPPEPEQLEQQLIEAVRQDSEGALLEFIKKPAGRLTVLAVCDDDFVFEIRTARLLTALLQQSSDDIGVIRHTALSLLRQTDSDTVVKELLHGILASEASDIIDPSVAIKRADALYGNIQNDLNDEVLKEGRIIRGSKSRELAEQAASMFGASTDEARAAFFKQILARAHMPVDQSEQTPAQPVAPVQVASHVPPPEVPPSRVYTGLRRILTWVDALLIVLLTAAVGRRIHKVLVGRTDSGGSE